MVTREIAKRQKQKGRPDESDRPLNFNPGGDLRSRAGTSESLRIGSRVQHEAVISYSNSRLETLLPIAIEVHILSGNIPVRMRDCLNDFVGRDRDIRGRNGVRKVCEWPFV